MGQLLEFASNHPLLIGGVLVTWAAVMIYEFRLKSQGFANVSTQDAVRLINKGAVVIDVRGADEFGAGHIVNAKHCDLKTLESDQNALNRFKKKVVLTVCNSGNISGRAAAILRKSGFENVFSIRDGMAGWLKDNMPLEK